MIEIDPYQDQKRRSTKKVIHLTQGIVSEQSKVSNVSNTQGISQTIGTTEKAETAVIRKESAQAI